MESHGVAGRVHVSAVTYELIRHIFELEAREPMEVKGKGMMQTYLLVRQHERDPNARRLSSIGLPT
jgi:class 3 adenylate cyclase